jgi:predicted house-cleaning noncanonical NTP pyrophosphatase (MazG superfamily)
VGKIVYKKLVRDDIPKIIKADGHIAVTRILDKDEFKQALLEKLVEEAKELLESSGDLGERADIAEVLKAIDESFGFDHESVEQARVKKAEKKGVFDARIFLEEELTND